MKRLALVLILPVLLIPLGHIGAKGSESYELGVYDPCSDPSCDPSSELRRIRDAGANAIIVTLVDEDGYALYPSKLLPERSEIVDMTLKTIKEAKKLGMRVFGLLNIPHSAWLRRHPDWIAVLSNGRPAYYLEEDHLHRVVPPSRIIREKECVDLLKGIAREIVSLGVDGLDISNFQFPDVYLPSEDVSLLSSYDRFTVEAFEGDTGIEVRGNSPEEWSSSLRSDKEVWRSWMKWKADQVTKLLSLVADEVRKVKPEIAVRPHLIVYGPLNRIDYASIASIAKTLYVILPEGSRIRYYMSIWRAHQVAGEVISTIYLKPSSVDEARRRVLWIASAGADGIYVLWDGMGMERYELLRSIFEEFKEVKGFRQPAWLHGARVVSVYAEQPGELNLKPLKEQGVSVIELDAGLSSCDRLYGDGFEDSLRVISEATKVAHSMGMRVVVYVPALEVVCDRVVHGDWAQESIDGRKLIVEGGELGVPWLEEGEIDMWMSPFSPHRDIIMDRVRRILRAGADGIWLDVPHLPEYLTEEMSDLWPDTSNWSAPHFKREFGEDPPKSMEDPSFPEWLIWRHYATLDFVLAVAEEVYNESKVLMVESSANDASGTEVGFDPIFLRYNPLLVMVPEVGPPSWDNGLSNASLDEWSDFYSMLKVARGSKPSAPIIPLTYGRNSLDSSRQLGLIIAVADGFFETNSENGLMTGSVGADFRKRAFWLVGKLAGVSREDRSRVAVLFSSFSRDLADTYVSSPYDVSGTSHMMTFRSVIRVLSEGHVQFDVVPIERANLSELNAYGIIIAPDLEVLTSEERAMLRNYGGKLLFIGKLGASDEHGDPTPELNVGRRIRMDDLRMYLKSLGNGGGLAGAPGDILMEEFGKGCRILSAVNVGNAGGIIRVPKGWAIYFDDLRAVPVDGSVRVPRTFLLLMRGDDGGWEIPMKGAFLAPPIDRSFNRDLIEGYSSSFKDSGVLISLGGPYTDGRWMGSEGVRFLKDNGAYSKLVVGDKSYLARFGREDYAVIDRVRCGGFSFYQVAGITRYGTRAALMWLLNKGVGDGLTVLRWSDDGDGTVELGEIEPIGG